MVAEPWLLRMGNQVRNNLKNSLHLHQTSSKKKDQSTKFTKQVIGILSFEVANVMSKVVHLHRSVTDPEISKFKNEIIKSEGIKKMVSCDETYLLDLAYDERLDDLNRVAEVVSRLGKKCSEPALQGFEHVYGDIVSGKIEVNQLGFLVKDMEGMVRKMERYVTATSNLYVGFEVLNELEHSSKKFHLNHNDEARRALEQKLLWHRQDVKHLKDVSLWNQSYDKVVELLARTVCTLYARIRVVFGDVDVKLRQSYSSSVVSRLSSPVLKVEGGKIEGKLERQHCHKPMNRFISLSNGKCDGKNPNSRTQLSLKRSDIDLFHHQDITFPCVPSPGRVFMECLSLSSSASIIDDDDDHLNFTFNRRMSQREQPIHSGCINGSPVGLPYSGVQKRFQYPSNDSHIGPKSSRVGPHATPSSTVGGSALALRYANVIILIEKLLRYPHLVGDEARDDLYQMLPTSLRKLLKVNLKTHLKNFAIYDAHLAHDWRETLEGILKWLAPLAHNMMRWQSERNFEQQQIVTRTNVLLLQTLYFADMDKTEAAICELLVGLNYICRYEHQQNALLDCTSSFDFEDWMEWQLQCQSSYLN